MSYSIVYTSLFTFLLLTFSCKNKEKNKEKNIDTNNNVVSLTTPNEDEYMDESFINEIKRLNQKWFESWGWDIANIELDCFESDFTTKKNINWTKYDINNEYLKQFDSLLITSNNLAIDLYSYGTIIEKRESDELFVGFDADSKVYIVNKKESKRSEIAHTGSYEMIEDAIWLNDLVVLLGYVNKTDVKQIPFIWIIDIEKELQHFYKYCKSFKEKRNEYFFVKYPNLKLEDR